MEKKTSWIEFRAKAVGRGIVQYDSTLQKKLVCSLLSFGDKEEYFKLLKNNNVGGFSKKDFYKTETLDENGNKKTTYDFKIKVNGDWIKKNASTNKSNIERLTQQIYKFGNSDLIASTAAQPFNLLRGWMIGIESGKSCIRTGALSESDFIQSNNAMPFLEIKTATDIVPGDVTSLRYHESVGDMEYTLEDGEINLQTLQFVGLDDKSYCYSLEEKYHKDFLKWLKINFPNSNFKIDNYKQLSSSAQDNLFVRGILLDDECIKTIIKDYFTRLFTLSVHKNKSFLKVCEVEYRLRDDITNEGEWIKINSLDDIEKIDFKTKSFFEAIPENELSRYNTFRSNFEKAQEKKAK